MLGVAAVARHTCIKFWIAFGTGKDFRYVAAHEVSYALGPMKALSLPFFIASQDVIVTPFHHSVALGRKKHGASG